MLMVLVVALKVFVMQLSWMHSLSVNPKFLSYEISEVSVVRKLCSSKTLTEEPTILFYTSMGIIGRSQAA